LCACYDSRTVNVKAQGLLNAAVFVRTTHGDDALERIFRSCSPRIRERCTSAIAINWAPVEEFAEMLAACDRELGTGSGKVAEEIGAFAAKASLRSLGLRLAFFLLRPEYLMKRVAGVWRQYNDEGLLAVRAIEDGLWANELVETDYADWFFCSSVTGWIRETSAATVGKKTSAVHLECRARRGSRCYWEARWAPGE
jgi:hypothetical protein